MSVFGASRAIRYSGRALLRLCLLGVRVGIVVGDIELGYFEALDGYSIGASPNASFNPGSITPLCVDPAN